MLPSGVCDADRLSALRKAEVYSSCVTVSIGRDCRVQDLGLGEEMVLITRDDVRREEHSGGDPHKTSVAVVPISGRDPSLAPPGKGALTLYAPCSIRYGDGWKSERDSAGRFVRGPRYRAFKQEYADTLIQRVTQRLLPELRRHIEVLDVATPLTYLRYTGNHDGAIMGFRPVWANIRRRVANRFTPVRHLYIGGQWAEYGGGVPGAVRAGLNSALLVLQRENPQAFRALCEVADGVERRSRVR
jgi:prolycopene isomerase